MRAVMKESTNAVSSVELMDRADCGRWLHAGRRMASSKAAAPIAAAANRDRAFSTFNVVAEADPVTVAVFDVEVSATVLLVTNVSRDLDAF